MLTQALRSTDTRGTGNAADTVDNADAVDDDAMYAAFGRDLTALIEQYSYGDWFRAVCWLPATRQDILVRATLLSAFALRCAASGGRNIERFVRQEGVTMRDLSGPRETFALITPRATGDALDAPA